MKVDATSGAVSFQVTDWLDQFERSQTGRLKQLAYTLARPVFDLEARRWLSANTLRAYTPYRVFREFGFPVEARRRWAFTGTNVRNAVVLVQGTGSGWDVLTWARLRPRRIIATDLYSFDGWDRIARHCMEEWNVPCEFLQAPLEDHSFLGDGSVDLCVSDAVFEHCRNLDAVLAESHRVLKPGGRLYAGYGPLWFCVGGDHYSGRGGLLNSYNHLVLPRDEYKAYVESHKRSTEGFQDGYRYVELDLFSKLTTTEYLARFRQTGFNVDTLVLELSSEALKFRTSAPQQFNAVIDATRGRCSSDDLLIKANLVRLTRR
jgi:SAM-dependent methyltransferase